MKRKGGSKKAKAKVIRVKRPPAQPTKPMVPLPTAWER
jgi:hypothetical protein